MATLVGSKAAKYWFPDWYRGTSDTDYLIAPGEPRHGDCHVAEDGLAAFLKYDIAPPEYLYTLKVSHSFWPIHWEKTMRDILFFQSKGVQLDEEIFQELYKFWEKLRGKKKAYLNVKNEEFFRPTVSRKYIHDTLHEAVAYYDEPLYKKCKKDLSKAMLSEKLFNDLSWEDKCKLAREELYVTALERFLISSNFEVDQLTAYRKACKLLITSMSKNWFPKFIVENWYELHKPDDHDWIKKFEEGLVSGIVRENKESLVRK